jgi:predicted ATPase
MSAPLRIYLVGAHSTGKTTLARWVRDNYQIPMISEVARGVLAEMEAKLEVLRSDIDLVNRYQAEVFRRQIESEEHYQGSFVSDRAFCNLAYAAHHATILGEIATDPLLRRYMQSVQSGIVFFVRPHPELLAKDGVRASVEWEEVVRSLSMQERVRLIERVLTLAGLHQRPRSTEKLARTHGDDDDDRNENGNGSRHGKLGGVR